MKRFRCHIKVERAQTGHAVAYLMKYTLKPPEAVEVRIYTEQEAFRRSNASTENRQDDQSLSVRNDIREGRIIGAVEAAWSLFEFRHVRIVRTVQPFSIRLANERRFIISSPEHLPGMYSSPLERYMKRPSKYADMDFLTYMESVKLYLSNKLPRRLQSNVFSLQIDSGNKTMYVIDRGEEERIVGRLRFVPPSNVELFSLRLIVLHKPMCPFEDARSWHGVTHEAFHDADVAMGLYNDGDEFDKAFDEAAAHFAAPSELRRMLVTLYQQGSDPKGMVQRHYSVLVSDILLGSDAERRMEMMRRVISISDTHGCRLLREHPFFSAAARATDIANKELQRARQRLQSLALDSEARSLLQSRYQSLNEHQKSVLDQILQCVDSRHHYESLKTDGKVFFLQGYAGTGKTYLLSLLRDMAESRGILVEMTATTGIAASLYQIGRALRTLLGIGIEEKDSSVRHVKLSKYGPRSERAELLTSLGLLVFDDASMMQRILFEHVDTILKDLRCRLDIAATSDEEHVLLSDLPYFGGLTIVLAGDYMQLLPVVASRRQLREEDGNSRYIPVDLLDEIPCVFRVWEQVRQVADPSFGSLLMSIAKGLYPDNDPLPLQSTAVLIEAYRFLWPWAITRNFKDVQLDRLIMCSTNALVDEHNENALKMFSGPTYCRPSATTIEMLSKGLNGTRHRQQVILPELTYEYAPTGVPPHMLKLKVGVPIMVVRNVLHPHLVNGVMFVVEKVTRRLLYLSELDDSGNQVGTHVLHRITFQFEFADVKVTRRQFPVRLEFASTVHKGQGQTLGNLTVDLRSNFFAAVQLYVALSRTLIHEEKETPEDASPVHTMPVAVRNLVLRGAVDFVEGSLQI